MRMLKIPAPSSEYRIWRKFFAPVVPRNAERTALLEPAKQSGEWFIQSFKFRIVTIRIYFCTLCFSRAQCCNMHRTESHSSGLLVTRLTAQCISQGPKKVRFPRPNPLPLPLVMDLPHQKHYIRGRINHRSINSYNSLCHIIAYVFMSLFSSLIRMVVNIVKFLQAWLPACDIQAMAPHIRPEHTSGYSTSTSWFR